MSAKKTFKWVVEITIDETWVADGFDPDDQQMHNALQTALPYARSDEIHVHVKKRPADRDIAKAQGYQSIREYRNANWKDGVRI